MWAEVVLGFIFLWALYQVCKKPEGLPPGLWGLPLVGHVAFPPIPSENKIKSLRKKYGDIFMIRIGTSINVFLCRFDLCKEACAKAEFTNRPCWSIFNVISKGVNSGIVGSNGEVWHNGRRFALRHLHSLGMGKSSMVDVIQFEARIMIKTFETRAGLTGLDEFMNVSVLNVIWQLVANTRYEIGDASSKKFHELISEVQKCFDRISIPDFFPWLTKIFPVCVQKKVFAYKEMMDLQNQICTFFKEIIDNHKATLDPANPRDYIDAYLLEMEDSKDEPKSTFTDQDLVSSIWDLFGAGSETVSNTLRWLIFYMARYPEVQKRMQQEIDEVVLPEIQPSWEDKAEMPYTEATLHEVQRIISLVSLGLQHCTAEDTVFHGYRIPKGSILYPVSFCSHSDEKYWKNPFEFRPERFLENNMFVTPKNGFMPFGVGRRQCLGESLARMEIFIFATSLLQKLTFSPGPDGISLKPMDIPIFNFPKEQKVFVSLRA
ncbi:cytochrome P450 2L1-like isoform X1 [Oratosquilla oratoria]|uniref:cytochrome P450 2L1-like isoform X1 n=2 Tax=Oratosquilla oratoria TaxID=337810 RepID=UPI003F77258C